jgi:cellulose synthase/poly-beta-1,6-N-acetylglucosamine synthase-like glycosyltransferase
VSNLKRSDNIECSKVIFWVSTALILYTFAGYPLLLLLLQRLFRRPVRKNNFEPRVSMLVAAYNEANVIADKVQNVLAVDYPPDRLEVLVASEASTDRTAEIVSALIQGEGGDRVRLLNYPESRGQVVRPQ